MTVDYSAWQQWLYDTLNIKAVHKYLEDFDPKSTRHKLKNGLEWAFDLQEPFATILLVTVIYFIAVRIYETKFIWWRKRYSLREPKEPKRNMMRWLRAQDHRLSELSRRRMDVAGRVRLPEIERARAEWRNNVMLKNLNRKDWLEAEMKKIVVQLKKLRMCKNCYPSHCLDRDMN